MNENYENNPNILNNSNSENSESTFAQQNQEVEGTQNTSYTPNFSMAENSEAEETKNPFEDEPAESTTFAQATETDEATQSSTYGQTAETVEPAQSSTYAYSYVRKPETEQHKTYESYEFGTAKEEDSYQESTTTYAASAKPGKQSSGIGRKFGLCAALAATFGLIAGGVFLGVSAVGSRTLGLNQNVRQESTPVIGSTDVAAGNSSSDVTTTTTTATASGEYTVAQVAENCMPAMVSITSLSVQEVQSMFGYSYGNESESSGSGIIVDQNDEELLVATNNHVISGANSLTVTFSDTDNTSVEAQVKGADAENDLAILAVKIADIPQEVLDQIKVIQIGNSDELQVGDQVVAIGNALGYGQSVSSGYISALNREITIEDQTHTLMQTDAAINPGNSGGALLNMKGELVGINEAKISTTVAEGMGYAIPVSTATPILSDLMSMETRYKVDEDQASYLGITCQNISSEYAQMYGSPVGIFVDSLEEGGPAATAGMLKGDVITKFDGKSVTNYTELVEQLEYYAAGESVEITFSRFESGEYVEQTVTVTLGAKANSTQQSTQQQQQQEERSILK